MSNPTPQQLPRCPKCGSPIYESEESSKKIQRIPEGTLLGGFPIYTVCSSCWERGLEENRERIRREEEHERNGGRVGLDGTLE